jgi:hypothetical protein
MIDHRLVSTYMNEHLTGATAGLEMFRRVARLHEHTERGAELTQLARDVEEDRRRLRELMRRMRVDESKVMTALGWVGGKASRIKWHGYFFRRSPLADLNELEQLRIAVAAKTAGWQVLRALAVHDDRISVEELEALLERADDQSQRLYKLQLKVAEDEFHHASEQPGSLAP